MTSARPALVVDASVAVKWLVEEEGSDAALSLGERDLMAPSLLRIETANVLRTLAARRAIAPEAAADLFRLLQEAPVTLVEADDPLERRALELALSLAHPVYDCLYLALAERTGRLLVTADARFLRALAGTGEAGRCRLLADFA